MMSVEDYLDHPVPLAEANISRPFVYQRGRGVSYVPMGYHQGCMATLRAWELGSDDYIDELRARGKSTSQAGLLADEWLENTPGAAFRTSVRTSKPIIAWHPDNLTAEERAVFESEGPVDYLSDKYEPEQP